MRITILFFLVLLPLSAQLNCDQNSCTVERKMTFWGIELYNFFYRVDKNKNESFDLTYLRTIEKEKNRAKSTEKFEASNTDVTQTDREDLQILNEVIPDVSKGDVLTVEINQTNTIAKINGQPVALIKGSSFGRKYINIWAGKEKHINDELALEIQSAREKVGYFIR